MHDVDSLAWDDALTAMDWRQGEHVTLVGPTGQGKTHLALRLIRVREDAGGSIAIFANKARDTTMSAMRRRGYKIVRDWPPPPRARRIVLWPKFTGPESFAEQRDVFERALADMFAQEAWCVMVDEAPWFVDELHLGDWLRVYWQQGRSLGLSLVAGMQRPRWVPPLAFSAPTHLFLWRTNHRDDLRALAGLGVADSDAVRDTVAQITSPDVLYVNTRTGRLFVTRAPRS